MVRTTLALVALASVWTGCIFGYTPERAGISGRLTRTDSSPVPGVRLTSSVQVSRGFLRRPGVEIHREEVLTDQQGRFRFAPVILFQVIPPPWIESGADTNENYSVRLPDGHAVMGSIFDLSRGARESGLELDFSGRPRNLFLVPTFGGTVGAGQTVSAHVGGALIVQVREIAGLGVHAQGDVGNRDWGASSGFVWVLAGWTMPFVGLELNARYLRPWNDDAAHLIRSGPEIAIDILNLRLSLAALSTDVTASAGRRDFLFGVGLGYF